MAPKKTIAKKVKAPTPANANKGKVAAPGKGKAKSAPAAGAEEAARMEAARRFTIHPSLTFDSYSDGRKKKLAFPAVEHSVGLTDIVVGDSWWSFDSRSARFECSWRPEGPCLRIALPSKILARKSRTAAAAKKLDLDSVSILKLKEQDSRGPREEEFQPAMLRLVLFGATTVSTQKASDVYAGQRVEFECDRQHLKIEAREGGASDFRSAIGAKRREWQPATSPNPLAGAIEATSGKVRIACIGYAGILDAVHEHHDYCERLLYCGGRL